MMKTRTKIPMKFYAAVKKKSEYLQENGCNYKLFC